MPAHALFPLTLLRTAGLPIAALDRLAGDFSAGTARLDETEALERAAARLLQQALDTALATLPESPGRTRLYNARRVFFQKQKLDAAALPESPALRAAAQAWQQAHENLAAARQAVRDQYDEVLQRAFSALQALAGDGDFQRGLLFASHDLLAQIPDFQHIAPQDFTKKQRQTAYALAQYATRAAAKTSPFSRFTTVSMQAVENQEPVNETPIFDENWPGVKAVVTPNVALLPLLYDVLLRAPSFYRALPLRLNPCVTGLPADGVLRWLYFDGVDESFQEMPASPSVSFIVKTLLDHDGSLAFRALLARLDETLEAPPEAREGFLLELAAIGLLEWQLPERGLSPGWCGGLYQFLGFLPDAEPVVVEAAALLQWLRTAARTLPFQSVEEAHATQRETAGQVRSFLEKYGRRDPGISPEQIFYEDVETSVEAAVPPGVLRALTDRLADCWQEKSVHAQPAAKIALLTFFREKYADAPPPDFPAFCQQFLREGRNDLKHPKISPVELPRFSGKMGALLQIFQENGQWRAAVNALFPGGGKLFARWLHLFSASVREDLQAWWFNPQFPISNFQFPSQGWHNANFQPELGLAGLAVPGGRTAARRELLLGALTVRAGAAGLQLVDPANGQPLLLTDLGLEAPESRPPAMQVLWQLGVPHVSLEALAPGDADWRAGGPGWRFCPRREAGPLVLARASWQVWPAQLWPDLPADDCAAFLTLREKMAELRLPRRFFARFGAEKPRYFDQNSPLLMQLFVKHVRRQDTWILLTEMLPAPEQCFVQRDSTVRAAEFVVEWA